MNEWHDLFVATAGSAAALTGLIFAGVSINLTRILSIVKPPERALLTNIPITILILSILELIPGQRTFSLGLEILIAALIVWIFAIRMDLSATWYPIVLVLVSVPCAWVGGRLAERNAKIG